MDEFAIPCIYRVSLWAVHHRWGLALLRLEREAWDGGAWLHCKHVQQASAAQIRLLLPWWDSAVQCSSVLCRDPEATSNGSTVWHLVPHRWSCWKTRWSSLNSVVFKAAKSLQPSWITALPSDATLYRYTDTNHSVKLKTLQMKGFGVYWSGVTLLVFSILQSREIRFAICICI